MIKQHITKKLVNLLSNQDTDYQINTPLLVICNYTIFHSITHNYKAVNLTLLNLMNYTHLLFIYKSTTFPSLHDLSPEWKSIPLQPTLSQWVFQRQTRWKAQRGLPQAWVCKSESLSSVGSCTPPFRIFPCPLFFTWFSTLLIIVSISGTNFLPHLYLTFSAQAPPSLLFPRWTNSATSVPKSHVSKVVTWGNLSLIEYYWCTLPGYRGPKPAHKFPVRNSNMLPYTFFKANEST